MRGTDTVAQVNGKFSRPVLSLGGHTEETNVVAWKGSGQPRIVTASDDNMVRLWGVRPPAADEDGAPAAEYTRVQCLTADKAVWSWYS